MPRVERRRDSADYDPAEQTLSRRLARVEVTNNPILDLVLRLVLVAAAGGATGFVSSESKNAEVAQVRAELSRQQASMRRIYQRLRAEGKEDEEHHVCFERRFTRLETKLDMAAPVCHFTQVADVDVPNADPEAEAAPAEDPRQR